MAFDYFVVLAEMRTGSNVFESNLNAIEGVRCHGELFNPFFINTANTTEYHGVTLAERDADPWALLNAVRSEAGARVGFRLFHDHDKRIWDHVLADRACAKIILTRNPLESYVSRKIAKATGQWRLGDVKHRKSGKAQFDGDEFAQHVQRLQDTQVEIQRALQTSGQTAFYVSYPQVNDLDVLNGIARWMGLPGQIDTLPRAFKKQNPEPITEKLANPEALAPALARIDRFDLTRTPNFEPRRAPMLDACYAGAKTPLLFLPLRGAPEAEVLDWMADLDGVSVGDLAQGFDLGRLEAWKRATPGHRSFTIVRHPLKRAYHTFCTKVLSGDFAAVREHMNRLFAADLPDGPVQLDPAEQRRAFKAYLRFAKASLTGQTGLQPWPMWASQSALLNSFATVSPPDLVIRESEMATALHGLAGLVGATPVPALQLSAASDSVSLDQVVDGEVLDLCRAAYALDYQQFGFSDALE